MSLGLGGRGLPWVMCSRTEVQSPLARMSKRRKMHALPITARPRPPFGAHSSFATRSSLLARIALHRVVTLCPCALTSVCKWRGRWIQLASGGGAEVEGRAYLKAVEHAITAEKLTLAGILGCPGENFIGYTGHAEGM